MPRSGFSWMEKDNKREETRSTNSRNRDQVVSCSGKLKKKRRFYQQNARKDYIERLGRGEKCDRGGQGAGRGKRHPSTERCLVMKIHQPWDFLRDSPEEWGVPDPNKIDSEGDPPEIY